MEFLSGDALFQVVSLLITMGSAVWHMSVKIEKTTTVIETNMAMVTSKMTSIEKDIASLEEAVRESRNGRVEIWKEVNTLRERAAAIEGRTNGRTADF